MAEKHRDRRSRGGSSSVGVGIVAFLLGFIFAFIVLFGSIFGVAYVAVTTDINEVFRVFGLENEKEVDPEDPDGDKYNYINAEKAPNIYSLITEVMKMANEGLGEINLNKIDALAPVTDTVLDMAYGFIDEVVDFDKEYFEDVPLTSIIDVVKNSMYYVRTSKIIETLNTKMGYAIPLENIPMVDYLVEGVEAQYATVKGKDESFRLPVLFDYYVHSEVEYCRTQSDSSGTSAYPANLNSSGDDYSFIHETTLKDSSGNKLYRVYYVPCKVTPTGIEEADYVVKVNKQEDANVSFSKNGETVKLNYGFRTVEFGEDTDFIAVKSKMVDGEETFTLDHAAIIATRNSDANADASNRYVGYSYCEKYAREYFTGPDKRTENDLIYGVSTVNNINFFKNVAGEVIEYDPLLVSDLMLDVLKPLNNVPVASVVNTSQADIIRGIFGDTSLGGILSQSVDFNELVDNIQLSAFLDDVKVDDKIMTYLVYNLSNISNDGAGNYTAIYDKGGENIAVNLEVEGGVIKSITDAERGEEIKGNTVADMTDLADGLTLDVFVDVKADDAIMAYLGYGITDAYEVEGQQYSFVGTVDNKTVHIYTDSEGLITKVVDEQNTEISGTSINGVSDRVNTITDVLALPDFIDVDPAEGILSYIGYGVYDIEASEGDNYTHVGYYKLNGEDVKVYIATEEKDGKTVISSVWHDGGRVSGTKISEVSTRLDEITDVLAITEFIDIKTDDAIMAYIGYGVSQVKAAPGTDSLNNTYTHTAKYKIEGSAESADPVNCYLTVDEHGVIEKAWYIQGGATVAIKGTKIGKISDRVNGLKDTLTIGELVEVTDKSTKILQSLKDTTISGLDAKINTLTVAQVLDKDQIDNNSVLPQLKDTKITELGTEIDKVLIQRIYADTVYGVPKDSNPMPIVDFKAGWTYYTKVGDNLTEASLSSAADMEAGKVYYTYGDDTTLKIVGFNPAYLYYELDKNGSYVLTEVGCDGLKDEAYDNALGKLTQAQWDDSKGEKQYYTYGAATGMWKLILYRVDGATKTEKAYTLNNFNNMVSACGKTVYGSTLGELQEAGIIDKNTKLDKVMKIAGQYIIIGADGKPTTTTEASQAMNMSEFTLKELLDIVSTFMTDNSGT